MIILKALLGKVAPTMRTGRIDIIVRKGLEAVTNRELREDGGVELREDGGIELRD